MENLNTTDVLLVTVTEVETQAVINLVKEKFHQECKPIFDKVNVYYDLGTIGGAKTVMLRTQMGSSGGAGGATLAVTDAIQYLSPSVVIMVGIAFGVNPKKQKIGDILVSQQIFDYDPQRVGTGKEGEQIRISRGDKVSASPMLIQRFQSGQLDWQGSKVEFGLILSGGALVDNIDYRDQLREIAPEAIGGEMEGTGLYSATYRQQTHWLLVKAICDWADGKKSRNKKKRQAQAAANAAAFTIFVLEQGGFSTSNNFLATKEAEVREGVLEDIKLNLINQVQSQLAREKNSKKYIPDILVEVATVKDQLRYFSCPVLFIEKIIDEVRSINFGELNRILQELSIPSVILEVDSFDDITLSNVYEQAGALRKLLSDVLEQLNAYFETYYHGTLDNSIPPSRKYGEAQIRWMLGNYSSGARITLETIIENLDALVARVFFIISRAGQGKTNLVCDFVEKVLLPRSINCVYFTGREFNHVRSEDIAKYFINSIFGDRLDNLESALELLNDLATASGAPMIIVVDGINEHRDIAAFAHHLERFTEKLIQYPNIKVVFTCRSEYYKDRFGNFDVASFREKIYFKKDLNRHMRNIHQEQLLEGYLYFFRLRAPFISRQADEILKNDTLLLRIFCEAYGDPSAKDPIQLPSIINIYRDSIFRRYFERKLAGAAQNLEGRVGVQTKFTRLLKTIITTMIENRKFTDFPIVDLDEAHYEALELLLGEDVVVRKNLANVADVLDERIEVLNFTFDEFRDFLLANHLVNVTFQNNVQEFSQIVDEFVEPNSSIAEGIRTYLFFASRQEGKQAVLEEIKQRGWYDEIFIWSIFSAEETLIQQNDLDLIKIRFEQNVQDAKWIIKMLTRRWNTNWFPILNITLLFEILSTINDETYDSVVRKSFSSYSYIFRDEHMWSVQNLVEECKKIVVNEELQEQPELVNLFTLLIYLFPIRGGRYYDSSPAFEAFTEFSQVNPDKALDLLKPLTTISSYSIRAEVWRMFVHVGLSELPDDLAQEAAEHVMRFDDTGGTISRRWIKEVIWFLERYAEERNAWYVSKELLDKMRQFSKQPHIYDWYENN